MLHQCERLNVLFEPAVGRHISEASQAASDASTLPWAIRRGIRPLLGRLPELLVALRVSLSEMASILGRRPILSPHGRYGRTAHKLYIDPLMYEYETILVSLSNLTFAIQRCLDKNADGGTVAELSRGIAHVSATLRVIQTRAADIRAAAHHRIRFGDDAGDPSVGARSGPRAELRYVEASYGPSTTSPWRLRRSVSCLAALGRKKPPVQARLTRSTSLDGDELRQEIGLVRVDDAVLYSAFQYAASATIAAFLLVASNVERGIEVSDTSSRTSKGGKSK